MQAALKLPGRQQRGISRPPLSSRETASRRMHLGPSHSSPLPALAPLLPLPAQVDFTWLMAFPCAIKWHFIITITRFSCQEARYVCRQAAIEGCQNPTP